MKCGIFLLLKEHKKIHKQQIIKFTFNFTVFNQVHGANLINSTKLEHITALFRNNNIKWDMNIAQDEIFFLAKVTMIIIEHILFCIVNILTQSL